MEDGHLLVSLALAVLAATAGALFAVRLGLSPIPGYILGGLAIGPNTPGLVSDIVAVEELANVGVILLMFTIGMHVSLRELAQVGQVAIIGGGTQILVVVVVGLLAGRALGWGLLESVFFGAVIAISSGVVMSRVLDDRGELGAIQGQLALAWSAIQDFATIILVVVLTALAKGDDDLVVGVGTAVGKAALFLAILIPAGSRALPWLFERVAALRNREVFILTVAAVALGAAYASSFFGLSLALGAFVGGIVVSESDLSHQIMGDIEPLRDIFVGLFFVSIGMLIDPGFIVRHLPAVLLTVVLVVAVKGVLIAVLVAMFRYPWRTALIVGMALSQAGEFSFLIARLGLDEEVISTDAFTLILAGSAISILLTPALVAGADPAGRWLERRLPRTDPIGVAASAVTMRGHAIICGYGRVGRIIGGALRRRGFPLVVIEQDQRLVRELRSGGGNALLGSADHRALLKLAHIEQARVLVVAVPDALVARRIVDLTQELNPRLDIVARTHSEHERVHLERRGVAEPVMAEMELALEMTRFTLRRFGVDGREIQAMLQRLRHGDIETERGPRPPNLEEL